MRCASCESGMFTERLGPSPSGRGDERETSRRLAALCLSDNIHIHFLRMSFPRTSYLSSYVCMAHAHMQMCPEGTERYQETCRTNLQRYAVLIRGLAASLHHTRPCRPSPVVVLHLERPLRLPLLQSWARRNSSVEEAVHNPLLPQPIVCVCA
jgi:hypothetical protein